MTHQRQRLRLTKEQLEEVQNKLKERQLLNIVVDTNQVINGQQEIVDPHEEERLRVVSINGFAIQNMANPSEQVQLEAVKQNSYTVRYIDNPTEKVQLDVVNRNVFNFQYIKNPTEKVQLEAVRKQGSLIQYIENPSEQVQLEAVRNDGFAIRYAIKYINVFDGFSTPPTKTIPCPLSEQVQLEAVRQKGHAIQYIENPSEEVQLEAVRQNGYAIEHIKNPSKQVQLEANKSKTFSPLTLEATSQIAAGLAKIGAITQAPTLSQVEEIFSKLRERTQNKNIIQLPAEQLVIQGPAKPNLIFGDGINNKEKENAIDKPPTNEEIAKIYSKLNSKKKKQDLQVVAKQAIIQANLKDMEEIKKSRDLIEIHNKKIEELEKTVKEFELHIRDTELQMTSIMDQVDILEGRIEEIQEQIDQRKFQKVV